MKSIQLCPRFDLRSMRFAFDWNLSSNTNGRHVERWFYHKRPSKLMITRFKSLSRTIESTGLVNPGLERFSLYKVVQHELCWIDSCLTMYWVFRFPHVCGLKSYNAQKWKERYFKGILKVTLSEDMKFFNVSPFLSR